jgi:hypothetical protein
LDLAAQRLQALAALAVQVMPLRMEPDSPALKRAALIVGSKKVTLFVTRQTEYRKVVRQRDCFSFKMSR